MGFYVPVGGSVHWDIEALISSFAFALPSSISPNAKNDGCSPSHRTPSQISFSSRYIILNAAIDPWCQYSILRSTASISFLTHDLTFAGVGDRNRVRGDRVGEVRLGRDCRNELEIELHSLRWLH